MSSTAESSTAKTNQFDKKGGRPFSGIWEDMICEESKGNGHYSGTCKYCQTHWKRAKPTSLKLHLIQCNLAPTEIKEHWKKDLYGNDDESSTDDECNDVNSKRKKNFNIKNHRKTYVREAQQGDIRNHFSNTQNELEAGMIGVIDKALLNAFVSCGIIGK